MNSQSSDAVFSWDQKPSIGQVIPLGLQHVLAAIAGIITPAIIVAGVCNFSDAQETMLIQSALVMSGIVTLLQAFPPFGKLGSGLPIIMGTSFAYVPALQSVGAEFGFGAIIGAELIGGVVAILMGLFIKPIKKLFPTVVAGTIIFVIGVSLYPTAVAYMAGGQGSSDFGSLQNWIVALITFLVVIVLSHFGRGLFKLGSILIGMLVGFVASMLFGMVNFDSLAGTAIFAAPSFLPQMPEFSGAAVATMVIVYIVNSVEVMGEVTSITSGVMDRMPENNEISGGIISTGIMSIIGALFSSLPAGTFGQNIGIVLTNRVINRWVIAFVGAVFVVCGFLPPLAAVLTLIPQPVIGGATISVFATISMNGLSLIARDGLDDRKRTIVGISAALGIGVAQVTGCFAGPNMPTWVTSVFGSSALILSTIMAIVLNLTLPGKKD